MNKTLESKIAAAAIEVGGALAPDKTNTQQNYDYISADKVLTIGGSKLANQGVVIFPNIIKEHVETVDRANKKEREAGILKHRYDARIKFKMIVTDGEEEMIVFWFGRGSDYNTPDKALYKAMTSGHKYFMMKLLNIGAGNEDGEHDPAPQASQRQRRRNGNGQRQPMIAQLQPEKPAGADANGFPGALLDRLLQTPEASFKNRDKLIEALTDSRVITPQTPFNTIVKWCGVYCANRKAEETREETLEIADNIIANEAAN